MTEINKPREVQDTQKYSLNTIALVIYIGFTIIVLGLMFIGHTNLPKLLSIKKTWAIFMFLPGLGLLLEAYTKKPILEKFIIPGFLMCFGGLFFIFLSYLGWNSFKRVWPFLIAIPGISLLFYSISGRFKTLELIFSMIIISISAVFLKFFTFTKGMVFGAILIIIGFVIIVAAIYAMWYLRKNNT